MISTKFKKPVTSVGGEKNPVREALIVFVKSYFLS